jgi:hypothetical protein
MTTTAASWSGLPIRPNIMAPSANSLTDIPVAPRILRLMPEMASRVVARA